MDKQSEQTLARLIRETRIAALGTLHEGEPNLAMVAYGFAEDFSAFYIHVSRLGKHTADMENNPRVSLLITAPTHRLWRACPFVGRPKSSHETIQTMLKCGKITFSAFPKQSSYSVWEISVFGESQQKAGDS